MLEVVSELIISVDGFARGTRSPAYYGFFGPEFGDWLKKNSAQPHQMIIGRRTYEALSTLPAEAHDEDWKKMVAVPGWVYSSTLKSVDWPRLEIVRSDVCDHVRQIKQRDGDEIRTLGSMSLIRQLLSARLVDRLRLIMCPLLLPETGTEPAFADLADVQFELLDHKVLYGRILILDYRPDGPPPYA
jgi:dihydrofolate reductase